MLPDYPPAMLSCGRYLGFGVIALLLAGTDLPRLQRLQRQDWRMACELALVGNLLYYLFLAAAIQLADAPLPTMLIGTLPIVIAIAANFGSEALPWRRLLPSLLVIAVGIALVNRHEMALLGTRRSPHDYLLGALLAVAAVLAWTWVPAAQLALAAAATDPRFRHLGRRAGDWRRCRWPPSAWPPRLSCSRTPAASTTRSARSRCVMSG
jgi:drug/metabolite transporter (DMT)-like permease